MKNNLNILPYNNAVSYQLGLNTSQDAFILKSRRNVLFGRKISELKEKKLIWINNPRSKSEVEALSSYNNIFLNNVPIFITGCSRSLIPFLEKNNFEIMKTGKEAILNLSHPHFKKRSLKEIIRTGFRKGNVTEFPYSEETAARLEKFKATCVHGNEPQLKYLYNDVLLPSNRLFVFEAKNGKWLGAITINIKDQRKVETGLILRSNNAAKGIMEALIYSIFTKLKDEGFATWSLGEVPYIIYDSPKLSKEFLINFTGRRLKFAYNYLGLYNFKNKFEPIWQEIYTCGKPKLNLTTFLKAAYISNLSALIINKIISG